MMNIRSTKIADWRQLLPPGGHLSPLPQHTTNFTGATGLMVLCEDSSELKGVFQPGIFPINT